MPSFSYLEAMKVMLIVGFIIVAVVALLNFFFLEQIAKPRVNQISESAEAVSIIISNLAINSLASGDHTEIKTILESTLKSGLNREEGLIQISVILYPSGLYYASTNPEFKNKKAGQTLLNKIEKNTSPNTESEVLIYEVADRTMAVLQYLRNVTVQQDGENKRIASVQILYDYNKIMNKTRQILLTIGVIILVFCLAIVMAIFTIISSVYRKLYEAFHQVSRGNFNYQLQLKSGDESSILFSGFNQMNNHLKKLFKSKQPSQRGSFAGDESAPSVLKAEHLLRKTDITCLVARIPNIQKYIEEKSPELVDEHVSEFLSPMEKIVKEYGGQIVRIMGDKVYTFFEGINSVDNSIRTALKLTQQWEIVNHERRVLGRKFYDYAIGLHSTEGLAGALSKSESQYTFIGKAAAVAEYLCSCAKREQILITSSMMDKASGAYQYQIITEIAADNILENDDVLSITPVSSDDERQERLRKLETSLMDSATMEGGDLGILENEYIRAGKTSSSIESSVTNMLEETLITTPLESIKDDTKETDDIEKNPYDDHDHSDLNEEDPTKSLWDKFGSKKAE